MQDVAIETPVSTGTPGRAVRPRRYRWALPYVAVIVLMALSAVPRLEVLPPHPVTQPVFNPRAFKSFAGYSDITSLYYRNRLWRRPKPYTAYRFEYPVLLGAFVYVMSKVTHPEAYFLASAAVLTAAALLCVWLLTRIPRAKPAVFAFAPALAFTGVLNWDLLAIALTLTAVVLHTRRHDALGALMLAGAVWTKFFPIVLLPVILGIRLAERQWAAAARILSVFAAVSVVVNVPVLLYSHTAARNWAYFFSFNSSRKSTIPARRTAEIALIAPGERPR